MEKNREPFIVAIDFDATICDSNWPDFGNPIEGAIEHIQKLHALDGLFIIIWTCRTGNAIEEVSCWLDKHKVPFHTINEACPYSLQLYGNDSRKIGAEVYVDDKQVGGLPPWKDIYKWILTKYNEKYNG